MAQAVLSQSAQGGFRFGTILQTVKAGLQRRALYRQTVTELESLSTRELGDLGLSRASIRETARMAAYGK